MGTYRDDPVKTNETDMNPYERLLSSIGGTRAFSWFGRKVITPIDKRRRGRATITTLGTRYPLCYLTTTGKRTGESRTSPLFWVEAGGDAVAVCGTNFGTAPHPAWSHNLEAEPRAAVEIDGVSRRVIARLAEGSEREDLWQRFVALWPPYERYAARITRTPRIYVLEPPS